MIFITALIIILIKYFGFIDSSWEVICMLVTSLVVVGFSIINGDYFTRNASRSYIISLEERVREAEEKLGELENQIQGRVEPIDLSIYE